MTKNVFYTDDNNNINLTTMLNEIMNGFHTNPFDITFPNGKVRSFVICNDFVNVMQGPFTQLNTHLANGVESFELEDELWDEYFNPKTHKSKFTTFQDKLWNGKYDKKMCYEVLNKIIGYIIKYDKQWK